MRCSKFEDILNDLVDRRVPLELPANAQRHSQHCPECAELLLGYRMIQSAELAAQYPEAVPESELSGDVADTAVPSRVQRGRRPVGPLSNATTKSAKSHRAASTNRTLQNALAATASNSNDETASVVPESADRSSVLLPLIACLIPVTAAAFLLSFSFSNLPAVTPTQGPALANSDLAPQPGNPDVPNMNGGLAAAQDSLYAGAKSFDLQWESKGRERSALLQLPIIQQFLLPVEAVRGSLKAGAQESEDSNVSPDKDANDPAPGSGAPSNSN